MHFGISTHVKYKNNHSGKASIKEQLESAHLWVPRAEEFTRDQVVCAEDRVHQEANDGFRGVVRPLLTLLCRSVLS